MKSVIWRFDYTLPNEKLIPYTHTEDVLSGVREYWSGIPTVDSALLSIKNALRIILLYKYYSSSAQKYLFRKSFVYIKSKTKMVKYEDLRKQRLEENKKRMEELNLPLLTQALKNSTSPKTTPVIIHLL